MNNFLIIIKGKKSISADPEPTEGRFSGIWLLNVSSVGRLMSLYIVSLVVTRGATQCPSMSLDIKVSLGLSSLWLGSKAGVLLVMGNAGPYWTRRAGGSNPLSSHPLVDQTGADNPTTHAYPIPVTASCCTGGREFYKKDSRLLRSLLNKVILIATLNPQYKLDTFSPG
jgi:hypothetical protein